MAIIGSTEMWPNFNELQFSDPLPPSHLGPHKKNEIMQSG